jgi:hypothetical protein
MSVIRSPKPTHRNNTPIIKSASGGDEGEGVGGVGGIFNFVYTISEYIRNATA